MTSESPAGLLKQVLENLGSPDRLDEHPWVKSLFVQAQTTGNPVLEQKNPGYRLALAVSGLFLELMPGAAPKRGKRLDTRWGNFGILAAQYFAPFLFGLPYPGSLRDAWEKIDRAILLCRFGERVDSLSVDEIALYKLVGDELDVAPISTISDWHVRGIDKLAKMIVEREQHLSLSPSRPSVLPNAVIQAVSTGSDLPSAESVVAKRRNWGRIRRWSIRLAILLVVSGLIFVAVKAWKVYQLAGVVRADVAGLEGLVTTPINIDKVSSAGPALAKFRQDIGSLREEAGPSMRLLGPWLTWIPTYGQDLAASVEILDLADQVTLSVQTTYQAAAPLLDSLQPGAASLNPQQLTRLLVEAQPGLLQARQELDMALATRSGIQVAKLSTPTQALFARLDPILGLMNDGLTVGVALPQLLGASSFGPKTYMLLVQNEDEIRPTGGFITSVGTFVVKNGNLFGLQFEESGNLEDWTMPYPDAPWQLVRYMNSPVLVLRDANWFTDYPTAVSWVEYLYAYNHKNSVDGVIAIDQQMLVALLKAIGPVTVEGVSVPISADNVINYMRLAKTPPSPQPADWYRKAFISQIANAIVEKLLAGHGINWRSLVEMMYQNLNQRHILLQLDDPKMTALLAEWNWDGAVRAGSGDYLLAVDTNIGFNKTNAVVQRKLTYDVDLTDLANPKSTLVTFHTNQADNVVSCVQYQPNRPEGPYPIHYCYWNYFRVFVPSGTRLDSATPHAVPADWMLLGENVPARVDTLEEDIPGVQGFGTLMVIPGGQTFDTSFKFLLPAQVITSEPGTNAKAYLLKIQKQPGTLGDPITIRIHLPASAQVEQVSPTAVVDGQNILLETRLTTDIVFKVIFKIP